jgi:hypothetical protein
MILNLTNIPFDVIINHIIPYTYNIQSPLLLEDIKNYYVVKKILMENIYDVDMIKHETLAIFYVSNVSVNHILSRHFSDLRNKLDDDTIYFLSNDKKMEIILLYNKIVESNKKLLDELLHTNSLR